MHDFEFEVERYELREDPAYQFTPDRRDFLRLMGAGLLVTLVLGSDLDAQESGGSGRRGGRGGNMPQNLGAWLHVGEDGRITVYTGKVEVGQNARTSLTQVVAEELRLPMDRISLVMGDTDLTPWDLGTVGSMTTPIMAPQLRKAAAAAREALLDVAASQWGVERRGLVLEAKGVRNPATGQTLQFKDLTKGQLQTRTIGEDVAVTLVKDWQVNGKSAEKVNAHDIVTGAHRYTRDFVRPGMVHGRVIRPSAFQAKLSSVDSAAAEAMPGITVVRDGDFLGVIAADPERLDAAAKAVKAEWKSPAQPSSAELFAHLRQHAEGATAVPAQAGNGDQVRVASTYNAAYIAHVPLETRAAVAEWSGEKLTVWTGSQRPFGVRGELAKAFGIPEERVRVIVPDTGSGYGGKHTGEAAIEAARLAKAAGKPVKLVWSREEEFTWAYFRPAGVIDLRSSAGKDGIITDWECHNYNSGGAALASPYNVPGQKNQFHATDSPLRQGSYRGLAATANHFARESHMDELAHAIGMEPLAFRLKNTTDPRLRGVLVAAAERFGWGKAKSRAGQGFGIAGGFDKGGYVACCAEVTIAPGAARWKVERIVTAFECGAILNPEHLKNQVEGGVIMGLGGALFEAIDFENGTIRNPRLSQYRVPRFSDVPVLETVLVNRSDLDSVGAGETPIVGVAPAIANAIFDATRQRLRSLPLNPEKA